MKPFLIRWMCTTVAVAVAIKLTGMQPPEGIGPLLGMALFLGILNAMVRPVLLLLSLPFIVLTLGLFVLVLNGLFFALAGGLVGLRVQTFGQAMLGAIIVSVVNWVLSLFFKTSGGQIRVITHHGRPGQVGGMKRVEGRVLE